MSASVVLTCLFVCQQLHVGPAPAGVGQEMVVRASELQSQSKESAEPGVPAQVAAAGIAVVLELPDHSTRSLGVTDAAGELRFAADAAGSQSVSATIGGVRCVASFVIAPARSRWLLGIVCVPLGMALLWLQLRRLLAGGHTAKAEGPSASAG